MFKESDFDALRLEMVNQQLIPRGIIDENVIKAFKNVPRHKFIPAENQSSAYGDFPLPIGENQTISQPYIVALMTQALEIKETDKILEIGTGSGYQTAILASLAREVYSIERIESLAKKAETILTELGFKNTKINVSDGTLGWQDYAPYDKITVTSAAPCLPEPLKEQINIGGRMVIPIAAVFGQILTLFIKEKSGFNKEELCGCTFVPLIGKYGYK